MRLLQGLHCLGWHQSVLLDLLPQPQRPAQHHERDGCVLMPGTTRICMHIPEEQNFSQHLSMQHEVGCHLGQILHYSGIAAWTASWKPSWRSWWVAWT